MSQDKILDLLEREPTKWFTCNEFALLLNVGRNSLSKNLIKIRQYKLVDFLENLKGTHKYLYRHKK